MSQTTTKPATTGVAGDVAAAETAVTTAPAKVEGYFSSHLKAAVIGAAAATAVLLIVLHFVF